MMARELIDRLRQRGVHLGLDAGRLSIRAPKGVLTDDDKRALALHKEQVLAQLRDELEPTADDSFPLTEIQQAYWVGRRAMTLGNVGCHAYREFILGDLQPQRIEAAWQALIRRHPMLRTVISEQGLQYTLPEAPDYRLPIVDLRHQADAAARLAALRETFSHQTFDPSRWPLFDLRLIYLDGQTRLHMGMDLLIADAASMLLLYREWGELYADPEANLPPLRRTFASYARTNQASTAESAAAEAYWRPRLADLPGPPELPLARSPEQISRPRFVRHGLRLQGAKWSALRQRAVAFGLTPANLLIAAYADILAAWSKTQRFLLTLTTFNAPTDYAGVVGDFTSTLLLEVDARAETFIERARRLQSRLLQDLEHGAWSGVRVMRELARSQEGGIHSIPVVFTSALGHRGIDESALPTAWLGQADYAITQTPQVWIDHHVIEDGDDLLLSWDAVEELFPERLIATLFAAYGRFLVALADAPAAWQWTLGEHLPAAQRQCRQRANATRSALPEGLLHEDFFAWARQEPMRTAIVTPYAQISYGELAALARRVARIVLAAECSKRPVGIAMEKGWEQVAAAIGILAAGAAYLPIDPDLPQQRRRYLVENAGLTLVLSQSWLADLVWPDGLRQVAVDTLAPDEQPLPVIADAAASDLAYVIYTSGSTGEPKGVMMEHRAVLNTITDVRRRFGIGADDAVLGLSSLSFDLSVFDIFGLLGCGGRLVLPAQELLRDPNHWLAMLMQGGVSVWNTAPALLAMQLELAAELPAALRVVMLSGDWVPLGLPDQLGNLAPKAVLYVLGGATEAAIWSNYYRVDGVEPGWRSIPYGWPLANQTFQVFNEALEPAPDGVPGRLFIGGDGLARGYWGDPPRTEAKFIRHPRSGERLYDTGDLGCYRNDGAIIFLGREDFQVKVRGYRIELGEIEAALHDHPQVAEAVAVVRGDTDATRRIIAYAVTAANVERNDAEDPLQLADLLTDPAARLAFRLSRPALRVADSAQTFALPGAAPDPALWRYRRTVRRFAQESLPLPRLADLLGVLRALPQKDSALPKYRYASAGTAYPVQVWVHVKPGRVAGLAAGLYYYHPDDHALQLVVAQWQPPLSLHLDGNQAIYQGAAFSLYCVADYAAIRPLYGSLSRDFCLLEAGYIGQLLGEEAARLGLGICAIGAMALDALPAGLDLGKERELVHSFVGGLPAAESQLTPPSLQVSGESLHRWLADRLPAYMLPETVILLESLPLTANGKVDRRRLPDQVAPSVRALSPSSDLASTIAQVFAEVLGLPAVDPERQVFELGGTSVHMVRIHRRLGEVLKHSVDILDLFRYPSVSKLANYLQTRGDASDTTRVGEVRGAQRRARRDEDGCP
jgi:amino acid adenylation domain-containing protein